MISVTPALLSMYTNGSSIFQIATKLQVLDRNYNVLAEFQDEIVDGQITCDKTRKAYRSFDLKLTNPNGDLTWGPGNLIWLDKYFKPFMGVLVNGAFEWIPLGVYPCNDPSADAEYGTAGTNSNGNVSKEIEFTGPDKMNYLGKCPDNLTVSMGSDIGTTIYNLLYQNGIETMFNLDSTLGQQTVPYDMTWTINTDYSQIITDLAAIIVWDIFYDANGYLRLRAPIDPTTTAPMLTMTTGTNFSLWAGANREMDSTNLANYIIVNGGSTQTALVNYVLQDNDPNSPTSIQNIGMRIYMHNNGNPDPVITTQALAQARAEYEYKNRLQVIEKLNFKMAPVPFMEHDDVYSITDPKNGTSGLYQVVSYSLPMVSTQGAADYHTGYLWQVRNFAS